MKPYDQTEYIVQALRMQGAMYEKDAVAFLAEHDAGVRTKALNEGAEAIDVKQDEYEAEERKRFGSLDHERVLQGEAVRDMAALLRQMADEGSVTAPAETATPDARQAARDEAADWLASYPFPADTNAWAHGRTEGIAWAVSVLRNPNPTKPESDTEPDFFQPGHAYTHRNGTDFKCVAVTTHPQTGERLAMGWHVDSWTLHYPTTVGINQWNHEYDGVQAPTSTEDR